MAYKKIQMKRGAKINMPILRSGELGFTQDEKSLYIGDGIDNQRFLNETQTSTRIDEKVALVTQSITNNVTTLNQSIASNIATVNQTIDGKTKINGESTTVNFIRNEIVKDGLVRVENNNTEFSMGINTFSMLSNLIDVSNGDIVSTSVFILRIYNGGIYVVDKSNGLDVIGNIPLERFKDIYISLTTKALSIIHSNNTTVVDISKFTIKTNEAIVCYQKTKNKYIYNRQLTSQEIQHNLSVLNNTPSINLINDYAISTDTDHIQDRTGRVQDTINRVFYKQNCKEFTSDGEAITVNNCMDGYVLSGKIEGQTVKNEIVKKPITTMIDNDGYITLSGANFSVGNALNGGTTNILNGEYTVVVDIIDTNYEQPLTFIGGSTTVSIPINIGRKSIAKTFTMSQNDIFELKAGSLVDRVEGKKCKFAIWVLQGNITDASKIIKPFWGLSSTQAVLSNLGMKYSFYMPTIDGKTRVMKATKGTQNWVEISTSEVRDTAKYDYKLVSNSDLGSVPSVYDYIDRARKVKLVNTNELTFDNTFNVTIHSVSGEFSRFRIVPKITDHVKGSALFCNNFKYVSTNPIIPTEEIVNNHSVDGYYDFWIKTLKASTVELFKAWLASNPVTVRYQLATPIEIPLTDEEIAQYDAYRKVIDLSGLEGARNSLEIKEDGSGVYTKHLNKVKLKDLTWSVYGSEGALSNLSDSNPSDSSKKYGVCDKYNYDTWKVGAVLKYVLFLHPNKNLQIVAKEGQSQAELLEELRNSDAIFIYQLAAPIVTHIPKEFMPTILTQATNTFIFGDAVVPSKVTIQAPVNRIAEMQAELDEIKALIQTPTNINLTMNYIEDEYNKNQSVEGEM